MLSQTFVRCFLSELRENNAFSMASLDILMKVGAVNKVPWGTKVCRWLNMKFISKTHFCQKPSRVSCHRLFRRLHVDKLIRFFSPFLFFNNFPFKPPGAILIPFPFAPAHTLFIIFPLKARALEASTPSRPLISTSAPDDGLCVDMQRFVANESPSLIESNFTFPEKA